MYLNVCIYIYLLFFPSFLICCYFSLWKVWLQDWCSYHGAFIPSPNPFNLVMKYMVIGDPATAPPGKGQVCTPVGGGRRTANNDLGADSMAAGYAQQLAQTITGADKPHNFHTYIHTYIHTFLHSIYI